MAQEKWVQSLLKSSEGQEIFMTLIKSNDGEKVIEVPQWMELAHVNHESSPESLPSKDFGKETEESVREQTVNSS